MASRYDELMRILKASQPEPVQTLANDPMRDLEDQLTKSSVMSEMTPDQKSRIDAGIFQSPSNEIEEEEPVLVRAAPTAIPAPAMRQPLNNMEAMVQQASSNDENVRKMFEEERKRVMNAELINRLGAAANTIGSALANTKVDNSGFEGNIKSIRDNMLTMDQMERMQDNDPNSAVSQQMRDYLRNTLGLKNIPDTMTRAQINKILPTLADVYNKEELRQQRSEDNRFRWAQLSAQREANQAAKQSKEVEAFTTKARDTVSKSMPYKVFQETTTKAKQIESAVNNPSGFKDVASIYAFMKSLDPESVVRESEYATASGVGSLRTKLENALSKQVSGQTLTQDQRKELLSIAQDMRKLAGQNLENYARPVIKAAKRKGAPLDEIFADVSEIESFGSGEQSQPRSTQGGQEFPRQVRKDGQVATVSNAEELKEAMAEGWK